MQPDIEALLQNVIFPDLENGRPGWDKPHTVGVVHYMKEIIKANPQLNLDAQVLIIAAYAHDWGYSGLFVAGRPTPYAETMDKKEAHMKLGAEKIQKLLHDPAFDYLTPAQKKRIIHLVAVHDNVRELHDTDELILMEADTLGVTDPRVATPTHTKQEYQEWRRATEMKRMPRFITDYSISKMHRLLVLRQQYYDEST